MIFSVIVPFYNEEAYIERCIRSLLGQGFDHSEYEIILIDNNSTDRSSDIVRRFERVTLLEEKAQSSYAARNKGLSMAKGDIIAFTDADCVAGQAWLSSILKGIRETGADIVLGRRCFPSDSSLSAKVFQDYENAKIEYCLQKLPRQKFFGYTNNMAVKVEVFRTGGVFGEELPILGDGDFIHRAVLKQPTMKVAYLPDMVITHLEVTTLGSWLDKVHSYGVDMNRLKIKNPSYAELSYKERINIYGHTIDINGYGFWRSVFSLLVLALGDIFYKTGRILSRGKVVSERS